MSEPEDPRWEWVNIGTWSDPDQWLKVRCNHLAPVPVHAQPIGELVAYLCPDCDAQLPKERKP